MAASGIVVEVLCPSGRRQKVKTNPSMTVFQILQQVCEKQGYVDAEYDLKHQRKILNVTSMMRFLNLPNNAKLELVTCEKARLVSNVTVALQMEDGTRYQDDFNPDLTLLAVLKTFITEIESLENFVKHEPVCIYMRNEYKGVSVLSSTTLKSIGITTGRAAIRVLFRDIKDEPSTSAGVTHPDKKEINSFPCELKEPNGKKIKLGNSEVKSLPSKNISEQERNIPSRERSIPQTSTEGDAYTSLSIIGPPPRQIFPDDKEMENTKKYKSALSDDVFNVPTRNEFADFKFPDSTADDSDPVAIDPQLIRKEVKLGMPCNRRPIVFSMESIQSISDNQEPDDSFFQVTIDDLRKRLSDLKSERKGTEEALLLTSALRDQKRIERVSNFEMIPVRLVLPGKLVIQGIFRPLETIGAIKEFLSGYLSTGMKRSELFVTPPRIVLKDKNQTLYDAKLFPAAVVHVSFGNATGPFLKQEWLDNLSTCDEADAVVDKVLKRKYNESESDLTRPDTTSDMYSGEQDAMQSHQSSSASSSNVSAHSASFPSNKQPKGAPKWFKTGR